MIFEMKLEPTLALIQNLPGILPNFWSFNNSQGGEPGNKARIFVYTLYVYTCIDVDGELPSKRGVVQTDKTDNTQRHELAE